MTKNKQGYRTVLEGSRYCIIIIPVQGNQRASASSPRSLTIGRQLLAQPPSPCNPDMPHWEEDLFPAQQRGGGQRSPCWPPDLNSLSPCPEGACCQPGRDSFIGRRACWKDCGLFTVLRPWLCKETVHINPHDGSLITSLNSWWTRGRPGNNTPFPRFARPWDTLNTLYLWPALARCGQENAAFATIV